MKRWEISALQAAMLISGVSALTGHALAVTQFMRAGGRDAWMSGIVALPVAVVAFWAFSRLRRMFPGDTVVQYLPKILGPLGYVVAAAYLFYFGMVVFFTVRITMDWLVDSILPETPTWVQGLLYMAAVAYTAAGGLDVLARTNQFLLPLLTGLGFVVMFSTMPAKDYRLLTPFFEKGFEPVFAAGFLALGIFGEASIISMYDAYVRQEDRKKLFKYYLIALVYMVGTLTGPLAGSTATLGYRVAQNMPYPTFQHWLMVSYARFFERTDLLAVHQWLAGGYVRCGLFLLMFSQGLLQLAPIKKKIPLPWVLAAVAAIVVAASEWIYPLKAGFDQFIIDIYLPAGAYLGVFLPPALLAVAWVRGLGRPKQGTQAHGG